MTGLFFAKRVLLPQTLEERRKIVGEEALARESAETEIIEEWVEEVVKEEKTFV